CRAAVVLAAEKVGAALLLAARQLRPAVPQPLLAEADEALLAIGTGDQGRHAVLPADPVLHPAVVVLHARQLAGPTRLPSASDALGDGHVGERARAPNDRAQEQPGDGHPDCLPPMVLHGTSLVSGTPDACRF